MKTILVAITLMLGFTSFGQNWTHTIAEDDFSTSTIEYVANFGDDGVIAFYPKMGLIRILGGYFCDDSHTVYFSIKKLDGTKVIITADGYNISDSEGLDIFDEDSYNELVEAFKSGATVKIKVSESYCSEDYFNFSLAGFTTAYNKSE